RGGDRRDFRGGDRREGGFRGGDRREGGFKREFNREDRGERRDFNRENRGERRDFNREERIDRNQPENAIVPKAPENILFGIHPVKEALEGGRTIEKIYIKRNTPATEGIVEYAQAKGIPTQEVPSEKLDWLARGNNHQGIVASIPQIEYADINQVLEDIAAQDRPALIVVLDGVTDIRNFGAIARTAECVGADAIVISAKSAAPVNAEAIKSSAGALTKLPVCRVGSLRNTLKTIQTAGISLVAATEKCTSLLYEAKMDGSVAVIMGSEDKGISSDILKICDARVSIPLLGDIESLNVSAAAAVVLYEVVRQRFEAADQE
ncbi:MAG: 23S rRNA (guanosine(2251)-2'-O)-methyltransferase RlmB, partial [Rikenellaceae bacterium]